MTPTRKNLFGWGRKAAPPAKSRKRRSGATVAQASKLARAAGYRGTYSFSDWLEMKHLDDRGEPVVRRLGDAYRAGVDARERDDAAKEHAQEEKRRKAREKAEKAAGGSPFKVGRAKTEAELQDAFSRGMSLSEALASNPSLRTAQKCNPAEFDRCVKAVNKRGGAANAYAVCTAAGTRRKKNPSRESAEVFEDFHGYPPSEVVTVTKDIHRHAHLASLGTLVSLDVWGVDERGHKITGFKKALLCSNEDRNQLFIEGGDQSVNLRDFGIKQAHEMETLGRVTEIGYRTNKTHLGDDGGEAVYVHRFRSTNENGKHVMVRMTREPDLVYDVRNQQLLFSGGSYEILREGIDK
jgi:hypothetical protein